MNIQETRRLTAKTEHHNYEWESEEEANEGELSSLGYSIITLAGGIACLVSCLLVYIFY